MRLLLSLIPCDFPHPLLMLRSLYRFTPLLLVCVLAGCAIKGADDKYHSGSDSIASIQSEARDAKWELVKAKESNGLVKAAHEDSAYNHVTNIQQHASGAAMDFRDAAKQYGKLSRDSERDHEKNKWFGWQTRHYWYLFLGIWAIIGVVGIVAQFIGLGWLSAAIFRFLPFSNPFALVRDWIQKRKDANTPTVNVTIQNPQAVRESAQQVVDGIDAAGSAKTPAEAAVT